MIPLLLALVLQGGPAASGDTLTLTLDEAMQRVVSTAPTLSAARRRTDAAQARVRQARRWMNPTLQVAGENLGATREVTGLPGLDGTEGQILLGTTLPLGGDRTARISRTGAEAREMAATASLTEADLRLSLLEAAARSARDRAMARFAMDEAQGLETLAVNLRRQAELGRISEGEAARAHLASVSSWTQYARAQAQAAASRAELARLVGADSALVEVVMPTCVGPWAPVDGSLPEADLIRARMEVGEARVREADAAAIPDITPQAGLRRSAGFSALYVGFEIPIPLFDRNRDRREAARIEAAATRDDAQAVLRGLRAERDAAVQSLAATEAAGTRFSQDWDRALDRTIESAEARYRLGEGTLTELLDSRRARLQALSDHERWVSERLIWRARVARYSGQRLTGTSICATPAAQNQTISETENIR